MTSPLSAAQGFKKKKNKRIDLLLLRWEDDAQLLRKDPEIFDNLGALAKFYLREGLTLGGLPRAYETVVAKLTGALVKEGIFPDQNLGVTTAQVQKIRSLADCMRLLAKKNKNTDARIVCLILKITCTKLLKKKTGIQFSKVSKYIERIAHEAANPQNHNIGIA